MNKPKDVTGIEKQTIKTLESLGFWWGNSPVSTEKQLTNVIDDTYMRLSEIKEDGSMSFLFESIGEFPSAWWQTLMMDEVREMAGEIDENAIGAIKEYLQWRRDEVYSTELFPPPDYDEVKDKIGETELTRLSADISRRNASSILDWINENIETEQTRIAPHPDSPIEEIAAYLTEKNRELYQRLADGDSEQDAPITTEFLEGLGFVVHNLVPYGTRCLEFGNACKAIQVWFDSEDMRIVKYGALDSYAEVGHIRTQSQLTNLMTALFGGGE